MFTYSSHITPISISSHRRLSQVRCDLLSAIWNDGLLCVSIISFLPLAAMAASSKVSVSIVMLVRVRAMCAQSMSSIANVTAAMPTGRAKPAFSSSELRRAMLLSSINPVIKMNISITPLLLSHQNGT